MRAYKVSAVEDGEVIGFRYGTTQADAREKRDELVELFGVKKKDVTIEEEEIPVAKAELIEFINGLAALGDAVEEESEE